MIDYFAIIHKYMKPSSMVYRYYIPHVTLVTQLALEVARRLELSDEQLIFIEEAAMLHDIGIIKVKAEDIGCTGALPYMCHIVEGRSMLEAEGLPKHALVAERHMGVGISKKDIIKNAYPLPQRDMLAESIEEQIISWADLYYGKNPKRLWKKRSNDRVRKQLAKFGSKKVKQFEVWEQMFGALK